MIRNNHVIKKNKGKEIQKLKLQKVKGSVIALTLFINQRMNFNTLKLLIIYICNLVL